MCPHSISASPTACPLRGHGRAGTQDDRLGGTGAPMPAQWTCGRRCRDGADVERGMAGTTTGRCSPTPRETASRHVVMAYIVMVYIVMACIATPPYSYGLYSCGLYSYGLHSHALYSYGRYGYGLYSCGLHSHATCSYGLHSYGLRIYRLCSYGQESHVCTQQGTLGRPSALGWAITNMP